MLLIGNHANLWLTIPGVIIIGREIVISALREWMSEVNRRGLVAASWIGKLKTALQMFSIIILLANPAMLERPWVIVGYMLLYAAAAHDALVDDCLSARGMADFARRPETRPDDPERRLGEGAAW